MVDVIYKQVLAYFTATLMFEKLHCILEGSEIILD